MFTRSHIVSFVIITVSLWCLVLVVQGKQILSFDYLSPFSIVISLLVVIYYIFSKWAWAWRIFHGWYVRRPDLRGTWRVKLLSNWPDTESDREKTIIIGFATIRQTLTSLSIRLMTEQSKSGLVAHSIELKDDGIYQATAIYRNEPRIEFQGEQSEIHHGALLLEIIGSPPAEMDGHYWTDRFTRGTILFNERRSELCDTYQSAKTAFDDS